MGCRLKFATMGNAIKPILTAEEIVALALKSNLKVYAAFKATERRLVYVHGDTFKSKPKLITILPTGDVEGPPEGKALNPLKEKALITFPFPQFLDSTKAARHLKTNFVWPNGKDKYALAH